MTYILTVYEQAGVVVTHIRVVEAAAAIKAEEVDTSKAKAVVEVDPGDWIWPNRFLRGC